MLNGLMKRKPPQAVAKRPETGLSADDLNQEISGLLKEKPTALFAPTSAPQLMLENLSGMMESSSRILPTFIAMVIVPTLLTLFYLVAFATPQYESEQSFTVQQGTKSQRSMTGIMALAAQFSGFSSTSQETYMVLEYLRSENVIRDIGGAAYLEPIFARNDVDYLSRLEKGLPVEDLKDYWNSKVIPELDTRSGIINVKVRAFSAEDAEAISKKLAELSEKLVNEVSLRSRKTTLERVEGDLQRSVDLLAKNRSDLLAFRNAQGSIDPSQDAEQIGTMMTDLTLQRIQLETEIGALVTQVGRDSPALKVKRQQAASLEKQIDELEGKLTGLAQKSGTIAEKLVQYEKLKTDLAYYEKLYTVSLSTYEQAREDAIKQQIFVVPIIAPTVAESSNYPSKVQVTGSVFLLSLAIWSIIALMIAAIKDHRI